MKVQCDVCEKAEAAVLCCADEAALCWRCDGQVHAANKLAGKHQRVPLLPPNPSSSSSSQIPTCDICQEKAGYFFCLEDRALLCRLCDMAIHTASPYVSSHQRFLITGVRVALQHDLANTNISCIDNSNDRSNSISSTGNNHPLSSLPSATTSIASKKIRGDPTSIVAVEAAEGLKPQWPWNYIFDATEFDQCYGLSKPGSSS